MSHFDANDSAADLPGLVARLALLDGPADEAGTWPEPTWEALLSSGAPLWALPPDRGGLGCDRPTLVRRYASIAEGSLTAAFILSQHDAATRRLAAAVDHPEAGRWLAEVASGRSFATVGISQLTTSRRHGPQAMAATEVPGGFRFDGAMPWVTAAPRADVFVSGAALDDGRQLLAIVPANSEGLEVKEPFPLAALNASQTSEVSCTRVFVPAEMVLAGPSVDVMTAPGAAGTGGLETSALALGQARAALVALQAEAPRRDDLIEPAEALESEWNLLFDDLIGVAEGDPDAPTSADVRARANALVLRLTQAYLAARKGSGFVRGEPAQRWARQALFFLVWSCPAPVARAAIRDLAGLCSI